MVLALIAVQIAATLDPAPAAPAAPVEPPVVIIDLPPAPEIIPFFDLPPPPTELPASVRKLVDAAFEADSDEAARAILKLAREAHPSAGAQLAALQKDYAARQSARLARRERERVARLTAADWTDLWKGEIELGGARSTGNTDTLAFYGAVRANREGLKWSHALSARLDFQQTNGTTVADRIRADWQPNYKVRDGLFAYGLGQYERDRFLGYDHRLTASAGLGVTVLSTSQVKLDLSGGPALRETFYTNNQVGSTLLGRAAMTFDWQVSPTLRLSQNTAFYFEGDKNNATSTSSLETRLVKRLKARLSYDLQYEKTDLAGRKPLDTTSRATLVYSF